MKIQTVLYALAVFSVVLTDINLHTLLNKTVVFRFNVLIYSGKKGGTKL